jgi:hypothetical protein
MPNEFFDSAHSPIDSAITRWVAHRADAHKDNGQRADNPRYTWCEVCDLYHDAVNKVKGR